MKTGTKNKNVLHYLKRPWLPETVFFFITLWQEAFRLSSRTAHKTLPVSAGLQHYYYYNFGDFVNGYIMAFFIDGFFNLLCIKNRMSYNIAGFDISKRRSALFATLISACIVVVFEWVQSSFVTSDLQDIPAGILGALLYYIVRLFALKLSPEHRDDI